MSVFTLPASDLDAADPCAIDGRSAVAPDCPRWTRRSHGLNEIRLWPDLGKVFFLRSMEILRVGGFRAWETEGGVVGPDACPTFGVPSRAGRRIMVEIAEQHGGFRFQAGGLFWAAVLTGDRPGIPGSWPAIAVGHDLDIRLLCRRLRRKWLRRSAIYMHELGQRGCVPTVLDQQRRRQLRRVQWRVKLVDTAMKLLPVLRRQLARERASRLRIGACTLADALWGRDRSSWPQNWQAALLSALGALSTVQVETFVLPKIGWSPQKVSRQSALLTGEWTDQHTLAVDLGSPFVEFLDRLSAARTPATKLAEP